MYFFVDIFTFQDVKIAIHTRERFCLCCSVLLFLVCILCFKIKYLKNFRYGFVAVNKYISRRMSYIQITFVTYNYEELQTFIYEQLIIFLGHNIYFKLSLPLQLTTTIKSELPSGQYFLLITDFNLLQWWNAV